MLAKKDGLKVLGTFSLRLFSMKTLQFVLEDIMNAADTAWIIVATALVLFMTLPGLALFYGGLVRARNVLSVFMQCFGIACLMSVLWLAFGYSIAFGDGGSSYWGGLSHIFLNGVDTSGGNCLCCLLFLLFGKCFLCICCKCGDNDLTTLDIAVGSNISELFILSPPPVATAEDASNNFINTANIDRAALNGSLVFFFCEKDLRN